MAQLNANGIFGALRGLFSALDATDEALLKNTIYRDKVEAHVTDGGTAGTAQTETFIYKNTSGTNQLVVSASFCTPIAVTADASNNATITVTKRSSSGGTAAIVATNVTTAGGTGSITAFLPVPLTLTVANVVLAANEVLTVLVSKGGTGVAIGAATSQARVEVVLEPVS